jgi:chitin disaccharide deacetylase
LKAVIVTGDDFGRSRSVNEAIAEAHCYGILTTTSLMVGAEATVDAVARAKRLPRLKVGLHIVLVDGQPVLPPDQIPALVDNDGRFTCTLGHAGVKYFFSPPARRQLEAEIRAQFERFRITGLSLDHVNAHHHLHLHPTVLSAILKVGRAYGIRAIRLPYEPLLPGWNTAISRCVANMGLAPWQRFLRWRLRQAGIASNHFIFGLSHTGAMTEDRLLALLPRLPEGVSELYFHPDHAAGARELQALTSPAVASALHALGIHPTSFTELSAQRG